MNVKLNKLDIILILPRKNTFSTRMVEESCSVRMAKMSFL